MNFLRIILAGLLLGSAWGAGADIAESDLPENVRWYAHADFKAMEGSVTGKYLLDFLEREVFSELRKDTGIDLRKDLEAATLFGGAGGRDGAVLLHGKLSDRNRTKLVALMEIYGEYEHESRKGIDVYALQKRADGESRSELADIDSDDLFSEHRTTYLAIGPRGQTLITQSRKQMDLFVTGGGRLAAGKRAAHPGSLLVLKADRSLIKAGMHADAEIGEKGDWNSSILQHMRQVAVVLADHAGKASFEAQLVTSKPELAESIRNILQGLIAIKSLDQDEDPEVLAVLNSVKLDLAGATIKASMLLEPETLREIFD